MATSSIFCSLLLVVTVVFASAQTAGTVRGTLTVNGRENKLTQAKSLRTEDWDMGPNHKFVRVNVTEIFLSDAPVEDLEDDFDLGVRGKDGTLHGLRFKINTKGTLIGGVLYDSAFNGGKNNLFASQIRFEPEVVNGKMVAGKVLIEKGDDFSGVQYEFNATFSTPVQGEPKPTMEGPSAAETGPARAVQEFLQAVLSKDIPALKKTLRREFVEMLENPESNPAIMGMLDQSYPADEVKQIKIVRVFDFGNKAWVEGLSKRKGEKGGKPTDVTYRIRTIRVSNEWKVQPM